ncbi:glycosyltransferase family 2 protein [Defluviimonas sp. WL0024]|uniref:Glycosyltransferase family 2 protein n=1 Tax=Albidovulum salinarum TaxID=2984153 RepID=A0ABT2X2I7_9RHOB|nr:glycosyltransferase family 2 protein [Defluviimonas sp. WL0024]MCU9848160.1 glycosyltransferase family 2 protein [Defluviimonas sp. WL0024]
MRKRMRFRAFRKRRDLSMVADRLRRIRRSDILVAAVLRNERIRLPYFLRYYRELGVGHFLFVDNGSDDGSREYLAAQEDVTLWTTRASYREARYGVDWLNWILMRHAREHWVLALDVDEFFVYPFCDTRPIRALTDWLDTYETRSFPAMLVDMYPKGAINSVSYREGMNPFTIADHFDSGNYTISKNAEFGNLWIQGGPRARVMFAETPKEAPSLNKIPLVKWRWDYCFVSSTHTLLPRSLNLTYDEMGGEKASGCLLHAKFLSTFEAKVDEELTRQEHFATGREYAAYAEALKEQPDLWCRWSEKYINWRQLEILGLMSKGNWA